MGFLIWYQVLFFSKPVFGRGLKLLHWETSEKKTTMVGAPLSWHASCVILLSLYYQRIWEYINP